jgi:hypothetical protein
MDKAIGDGRGRRVVAEELAPFLKGEVGGDDGRRVLAPL